MSMSVPFIEVNVAWAHKSIDKRIRVNNIRILIACVFLVQDVHLLSLLQFLLSRV